MYDFVAFDTETTGINSESDAIIEIAAIRFSQGVVKERFVSLIDPGCPIPAAASAVNGITNEMVKGAASLSDVLGQFSLFCGGDILVAHRASFDFKFLSAAFKRLNIVAPHGLVLDTLNIAKQSVPGLINYRLSGLINHFGLSVEGKFHRAELDSYCCGLLFLRLVREISGDGEIVPLQNLINLSGAELYFPKKKEELQLGLF